MKTKIENNSLTELSREEYETIHGGESLWYWVSYSVGMAVTEAKELAIDAYVYIQSSRPIGII